MAKKIIKQFKTFEFPVDYLNYSKEEKKDFCLSIIDVLLAQLEKDLDPTFNKINFLNNL